jgi:lysophospholipase L1-like esterase
VSPPPLKPGTWISSPQTLEDVRSLSSCYQTLAEQLHIHFISTLDWNLELTFDGVHFSEKDHAQFSEKLFAALTELSIL